MKDRYDFNDNIYAQISKYVDKLTKNLDDYRNDVYLFKEDIKLCIIVIMEELVANEYTVEAALKEAIDRCEKDEFIKRELDSLKKTSKNTKKIYFLIYSISFSLSFLLFCIAIFHNLFIAKQEFTLRSYDAYSIIRDNKGTNDTLITEKMKNSLKEYVNSTWYVESGSVYLSDTSFSSEEKNSIYTYPENSKFSNTSFLFSNKTYHDDLNITNSSDVLNETIVYKIFSYKFFILVFIIFSVYWITFALGARCNILSAEYDNKWLISIFLFNILGYLAFEYSLDKERKRIALVNLE